MAMATTFEAQTSILADLWMDYRGDEEFKDFIEYNDLGLPLAYAVSSGIVESSPLAKQYIEETFSLLLASVNINEDLGYDSLDDVFGSVL
jgi:hypothetical protein